MKPVDGVTWIKGWFDGDFTSVTNTQSESMSDFSATQVIITRGRFSDIKRVSGPPSRNAASDVVFQRSVPMVHLEAPGQPGWVTQVYDLYIPEWSSASTASNDSSSTKTAGRLTGWAWAKILPPSSSDEKSNPQEPEALDPKTQKSDSAQSEDASSKPDDVPVDTATPASPEEENPPIEPPLNGETSDPPAEIPNPCTLCTWTWPVIVFILIWLTCSLYWAAISALPFFLRCVLTQIDLPSQTRAKQWLMSALVLVLSLGSFAFLIAGAIENCSDIPYLSLCLMALAVILSSRLVHCWVAHVVAALWVVAALISCPGQPATCSVTNASNLLEYFNERGDDLHQRVEEVFRPDRESQEVVEQLGESGRLPTLTIDEAIRDEEKVFNCLQGSKKYQIYMGEGALFDLNDSNLKEDSKYQLIKLGELIGKHPGAFITIVGHADKTPHKDGPKGNLFLSELRASSVADWLVDNNFAKADKITAMGVGDRYPMLETQSEYRGNRRVEVRVECPKEKP